MVLKIEEGSVLQLHMNPLMGRKRVANVCEHLRMKFFSVYLRVTMSFSIFHFGQSLDIATWSP